MNSTILSYNSNANNTPTVGEEGKGISRPSADMDRLFSVAFTNATFRQLLLSKPAKALANGCGAEQFNLPIHEYNCLISANVDSLTDLANIVLDLYGVSGKEAGDNGDRRRGKDAKRPTIQGSVALPTKA